MSVAQNKRLTVSVIIPTYNRAAYIQTAIQSALDQTRRPDEIIVVDDGSTDETPMILAHFGPPVVVVRQPNGGEAAARNAGLRKATCDTVIFLDSDDLLQPACIERCAQALAEHPDVGVVYTDAYLCSSDGKPIGLHSRELPGIRPSGMILGELTRRNFIIVTSMVRRSCLGEVTFEEGMTCAADYDFWRKMAARCKFKFLNEPLMCYRFHEAMTVETRAALALGAEVEVQRRILQMREFEGLPRVVRARAHCFYGAKLAVLGQMPEARRQFRQAIRTSPMYHGGYALLGLSLLGARALNSAILQRRHLAGNRLGARAAAALRPQDRGPLREASLSSAASA
jgi:glycosyltransferase involved in cell wall biosynthesis